MSLLVLEAFACSSFAQVHHYNKSTALIIAVNDYPHLHHADRLPYSESDATSLTNELKADYGFTDADIIPLIGPNAKHEIVKSKLAELVRNLGPEDSLLIYFNGHGQLVGTTPYWMMSDTEADLADPVPSDMQSTAIDVNTYLISEIARHRSGHVLVISDNCHSGAIGDVAAGMHLINMSDDSIDRDIADPGGEIFASTGANLDSYQADEYQAARFTKHLVSSLIEYSTVRTVFEATIMFGDIKEAVEGETWRMQTPIQRTIPGLEGNYMFFTKAGPAVPAAAPISHAFGLKGKREYLYAKPGALQESEVDELEAGIAEWRNGERAAARATLEKYQAGSARARGLLADTWDYHPETQQKAFELFLSAASDGDPYAAGNLAWTFGDGKGVEKDLQQAKVWAGALDSRLQIYPDDDWATSGLAYLYRYGYGVAAKPDKAREMMKEAADKNNYFAACELIDMMQTGEGAPGKDEAGAFQYAKEFADRTHSPPVLTRRGVMYLNGTGCRNDDAKAFADFSAAADAGDEDGMWYRAYCYYTKRGTGQDLPSAAHWADSARLLKQPDAAALLIEIYCSEKQFASAVGVGETISEDCPADSYYAQALHLLAEIYKNGADGVPQNSTSADHFAQLSRAKGYRG